MMLRSPKLKGVVKHVERELSQEENEKGKNPAPPDPTQPAHPRERIQGPAHVVSSQPGGGVRGGRRQTALSALLSSAHPRLWTRPPNLLPPLTCPEGAHAGQPSSWLGRYEVEY